MSCPRCGYCPSCGRGGTWDLPNYPYAPYTITWGGTSVPDDKSFQAQIERLYKKEEEK